jgi:hypothetical protein
VLKREVPNASSPPVESETTIIDYEILNDPSYFVLGYYAINQQEPNSITPPLRVLLLDKRTNSWKYLEIQPDPDNACVSTVVSVKSMGEKFFIATHMTPDASCQFVLSHNLKLEHILFGSPAQVPSSRRLIVEGNADHFAMTHPLSLSLYDPASAKETPLLPVDDDCAIKWIDDELSDLIDDAWCRENNSPCEASGMSGMAEDVFVNDRPNAVAMHVQYFGDGMGPRAENFKADVIYVFDLQGKTVLHQEFKPDVLEKMIGKYDMQKLTQPSILRRLFSRPDTPCRGPVS